MSQRRDVVLEAFKRGDKTEEDTILLLWGIRRQDKEAPLSHAYLRARLALKRLVSEKLGEGECAHRFMRVGQCAICSRLLFEEVNGQGQRLYVVKGISSVVSSTWAWIICDCGDSARMDEKAGVMEGCPYCFEDRPKTASIGAVPAEKNP